MTIPVRIECECGQPYVFEIEPVDGKMPTTVGCPTCGRDGTAAANEVIARVLASEVVPAPAGVEPAGSSSSKSPPPEGFLDLDFVRTFPHVFWVSSVGTDTQNPEGFRYKVLTMRREPELTVDIVLLRESVNGKKTVVTAKRGSLSNFGMLDAMNAQLGKDKGVTFERFDFSDVRSLEDFRARAIAAGWDMYRPA